MYNAKATRKAAMTRIAHSLISSTYVRDTMREIELIDFTASMDEENLQQIAEIMERVKYDGNLERIAVNAMRDFIRMAENPDETMEFEVAFQRAMERVKHIVEKVSNI